MKKTMSIGKCMILSFNLTKGWNKETLCNTLMDHVGMIDPSDTNIRKYGEFFLKIYGTDYDCSIVPEELSCHACPKNHSHRKFDDYNGLREQKEEVLVLKSEYADFREYEIYCSYYTDKDPREEGKTKVELWANPASIFSTILKGLGLGA